VTPDHVKDILKRVKEGSLNIDKALEEFRNLPYKDLDFAKIDNHREIRTGYPEVIYCHGKTVKQVRDIVKYMTARDNNILATRATKEMFEAVKEVAPEAKYHESAKMITVEQKKYLKPKTFIAVISAGTSDMPVAEEAAITAEIFGNKVKRYYDMGVSGIHRLYDKLEEIREARIIIVVAGMEGALPSIVGGMVHRPVVAVPTSIGYGANFNGLSALLGMLTSCASGITVVNIDNGFGAGYYASIINKL
jgi:NCAIR mutase (PurE)-related protein